MFSSLYEAVGSAAVVGIRGWVRLTGKRVRKREAPWLSCPMGPRGRIGAFPSRGFSRRRRGRPHPKKRCRHGCDR